jgi:hypothetical protein
MDPFEVNNDHGAKGNGMIARLAEGTKVLDKKPAVVTIRIALDGSGDITISEPTGLRLLNSGDFTRITLRVSSERKPSWEQEPDPSVQEARTTEGIATDFTWYVTSEYERVWIHGTCER